MRKLKSKPLTFVVEDMSMGLISLVQCRTTKRTINEAWEVCRAMLYRRVGMDPAGHDFSGRFELVMTLPGLVSYLDERKPLRRATPAELKALQEVA